MDKKMKELTTAQLKNVSGGDNGDADCEISDTPDGVKYRYNIGDHVEVYWSELHLSTRGGIIIERSTTQCTVGCSRKYIGYYHVQLSNDKLWTTANHIQT